MFPGTKLEFAVVSGITTQDLLGLEGLLVIFSRCGIFAGLLSDSGCQDFTCFLEAAHNFWLRCFTSRIGLNGATDVGVPHRLHETPHM